MYIISTLLLVLSLTILLYAILFVRLWHKAHSRASVVHMLRENIGHIGISAIVEYPDTTAPLLTILEDSYPRSEAIIITDLQNKHSTFGELVQRFHLVKVNHSHLAGVRALYRSRHRAFRRVVMVDLPYEHREQTIKVTKEVASFSYILHLQGESLIAHDTLTYCANIIASHPISESLSIDSIVGASARIEHCNTSSCRGERLLADRVLAWSKESLLPPAFMLAMPAVLVLLAHLTREPFLLFVAGAITATMILLLYLSCRIMAEKGLLATLDTILQSFYRFLLDKIKKLRYLYNERGVRNRPFVKYTNQAISKQQNNQNRI